MRCSLLFLIVFISSACTTPEKIGLNTDFDPDSVKNMVLHIHPVNSIPLLKLETSSLEEISKEISHAFLAEGYVLKDSYSIRPDPTSRASKTIQSEFSHRLEVTVDSVQAKSAPPGFSFAVGNSDPRSPTFQKLDVVPITCKLVNLETKEIEASLTEDKPALSKIDKEFYDNDELDEKYHYFYVNGIGSTCYHLLNQINVQANPTVPPDNQRDPILIVKPSADKPSPNIIPTNQEASQTPGVQQYRAISIEAGQETPLLEPAKKQIADADFTTKKKVTSIEKSREPKEPVVSAAKSEADFIPKRAKSLPMALKGSSVDIETNNAASWKDKKITIFNQGDTVILEFGNNRR